MELPPWTYSRLEKFETCPKQFYHLHVAKDVVDLPSEQQLWGKRVHDAMEKRIRDRTPLPEGMTHWEGFAAKIDALPGAKYTEYKMALDKAFTPAPWDSCWTRGIADLVVVGDREAVVLDYKTGRKKLTEQLQLYAAYTFAHFPHVEEVKAGFAWLKAKTVSKETYTKKEIHVLWQPLLARAARLEKAYEQDVWQAKPSGLCRGWCPVTACEHYQNRR